MRLEVITPERVCLDRAVRRIVAEAPDGHFGMLPNHGDFVTALVPGILTYEPVAEDGDEDGDADGPERFVALHSGMLVKCGAHVRVAVRAAIAGDDLAWLRARVETEFRAQDELERDTRAALARLEASMVRRFVALEGTKP